ncbi:MAG TPA: DUF72 domain-containing protein [Polyangiaceae bacterium]|nr:DUF72 domain-containing protein [Polyangiaceae bacterium]
MSWNYAGWSGIVYSKNANSKELARHGLAAYARHPLLSTVEIDRSYYEPLPAHAFADFAKQVPDSFRFVVKAHEDCVVRRYPQHARYGKKRGQVNSLFLDAGYATEHVVAPTVEGLKHQLGVLLFQFPPQDVGSPLGFARQLEAFLRRLPAGVVYAVELRNRELLGRAYAEALAATGAVHCHNVWGEMPALLEQIRALPPVARRPLVIRWLMRPGVDYQSAGARYSPFDRLVDEDVSHREQVARIVTRASEHGVPAFTLIDNKAEGCAPESAARLARCIVEKKRTATAQSEPRPVKLE